MTPPITLDGRSLTIESVRRVAAEHAKVVLADESRDRVRRVRRIIDDLVTNNRVVYGVTTGFGKMSDVAIPPARQAELQINLVRSHAAGVGPLLTEAGLAALAPTLDRPLRPRSPGRRRW